MHGGLFHAEPDEPSDGGAFFGDEPDEEDRQPTLWQDETEEADGQSACLLGIEKDEVEQTFSDSPDDSSDYAYEADVESDLVSSRRSLFDMSFTTLNRFMAGQLCKAAGDSASSNMPAKKRRCYNNAKRAAKAAAGRAQKQGSTAKRVPRNDPDTWYLRCVHLSYPVYFLSETWYMRCAVLRLYNNDLCSWCLISLWLRMSRKELLHCYGTHASVRVGSATNHFTSLIWLLFWIHLKNWANVSRMLCSFWHWVLTCPTFPYLGQTKGENIFF